MPNHEAVDVDYMRAIIMLSTINSVMTYDCHSQIFHIDAMNVQIEETLFLVK